MWFRVHNTFLEMLKAVSPALAAMFMAAGMPEDTWVYIP